jgi:hypothetical protein
MGTPASAKLGQRDSGTIAVMYNIVHFMYGLT